ncbi:MAG: zeta toxin family protein [Gammaproteobacteria bacterium]|nr:zeta toxin family protein [Gammaproteobacteria bacterium]
MVDIQDDQPTFTIVMGCNGSGKTAWKRANREVLAGVYLDLDTLADGVGDWDSEVTREEVAAFGEVLVEQCLNEHQSYGLESTYSDEQGVNQVTQAKEHGYRIHGYFLGTRSAEINLERINQRVLLRTGHKGETELLAAYWYSSLVNLRRTVELFDELTIFDNSEDYNLGFEDLPAMVFFQQGHSTLLVKNRERPDWFKDWYVGWLKRKSQLERQDRNGKEAKRPTSK